MPPPSPSVLRAARTQAQRAARRAWAEAGAAGFYRGCLANLVRTIPAAAITFTSFELLTRTLHAAVARAEEEEELEAAGRR